jgi:hypothetical protein
MTHAAAGSFGAERQRWAAKEYLLLATGVAVVAGVGVGVMFGLRRRSSVPTQTVASDTEVRRREALLRQLATHLGNPDIDPSSRPVEEILLELQYTLGLQNTEGEWTTETEKAIRDMLASPAPSGNPWRPRLGKNPEGGNDDLEPNDNWEAQYQQEFSGALQSCYGDASVISFDQCVVSLLERIFPASGSFMLCSGTGAWKRAARDRARGDLTQALGTTELQARAVLTRNIGLEARQRGSDVGQAVRAMQQHAWPTVEWDAPQRANWQAVFARIASTVIHK